MKCYQKDLLNKEGKISKTFGNEKSTTLFLYNTI